LKRYIISVLFICLLAVAGQAQTITGTVTNGTTDKPAGGDEVTLIKLSQGMDELATTKTNGRGEFKLNGNDPKAMYLVRVHHSDVNYHQPVRPGDSNLHVTVYDAAPKVSGLKLLEQSEVLQAKGDQIQGIALFRISNNSSPKLTQPAFEFYLPDGASVRMGQAIPESGMPVQSAPSPLKEKNKYVINFPVRPGVTQFEVVYTMPYTGSMSIHPKLTLNADHYYVVTAKGVKFASQGKTAFQATDAWPTDTSITGVDVHTVAGVAPDQDLAYEISGTGVLPEQTASAPSQAPNGQQQPQQQGEDTRPGGGLGVPNERPDPLHSGQWLFLGVLSLFLAAGATYVYTSNQPAGTAVKKPQDRGNLLMEAMKEEIFQLETDRLQGKISGKDYESAKAALDKTLQRAVQRQKA
jgi:hypothetical protein